MKLTMQEQYQRDLDVVLKLVRENAYNSDIRVIDFNHEEMNYFELETLVTSRVFQAYECIRYSSHTKDVENTLLSAMISEMIENFILRVKLSEATS